MNVPWMQAFLETHRASDRDPSAFLQQEARGEHVLFGCLLVGRAFVG